MTHDPREALEQIRAVCIDNADVERKDLALRFILNVAEQALKASAPNGEPVGYAVSINGEVQLSCFRKKRHCAERMIQDHALQGAAVVSLYTSPPAAANIELLKRIEYASRKASLTDYERIQDVRTIVCGAITNINSEALHREAPASSGVAIELAYGLLWIVGCDRSTTNGNALYLARKALYERIDKDGQARGITAARKALADNPFHNLPDPVDTGVFPRTDGRPGDAGTGDGASGAVAAVRDDGDSAGAAIDTGLDRPDAGGGARENIAGLLIQKLNAGSSNRILPSEAFEIADAIAALSTPSDAVNESAEAIDPRCVKEAMEDGKGFWRSCCGCHESNEGYPTGPYSTALKCHLGLGCSECGGIGAVWDSTDYSAYGAEPVGVNESAEARLREDARRYRRLQILGCAPYGTQHLLDGDVMRFTNLDVYVDSDIERHPSRGEAISEGGGNS